MCQEAGCTQTAVQGELVFGEDGELVPLATVSASPIFPACPVGLLNGSWLLEIRPNRPIPFSSQVRGPMRIEVGSSSLRCSGDLYTRRTVAPIFSSTAPGQPTGGQPAVAAPADEPDDGVILPGIRPWYPSFPQNEYSWYFRSTGVTYANGVLTVTIVRHLWNPATQEFISTDAGTLVLSCQRSLIEAPLTAQKMHGTLTIGGSSSPVTATKTSSMYRGCRVEIDAMVNRVFPASATIGSGAIATFRSIYATAGWDMMVVPDEIDIPDDPSLTVAELETLLAAHRQPVPGEIWRLWLLVGSTQNGFLGLMFDDDTVPREGAAVFSDMTLGNDAVIEASARGKMLRDVPAAFLRTLVHEAGHAFNLFHPKQDVHLPGIGTEIMNQTGDVIGFATPANPYPLNASFVFGEHNRLSLVHSPDPQVRPGWKNFGWGHGNLSPGLPAPVDVAGLSGAARADGLALILGVPKQAFVGEFVTAEITLTNTGDQPREVTALLTLSEGDLLLQRTSPLGQLDHVVDVVIGCGPRPTVLLAPGESVSSHAQIFFTNQGVTFDQPGRHTVVAQLEVDPMTTVHSPAVTIDVRTPASEAEIGISAKTLDSGVGRAFALGDFGANDAARAALTDLAHSYSDTETGAASALVMANSLSRSFTDFAQDTTRAAAPSEAESFLDLAVNGRTARRAVELAVAVASPTEKDAPVVADTLARVSQGTRGGRASGRKRRSGADITAAEQVASDFVRVEGR